MNNSMRKGFIKAIVFVGLAFIVFYYISYNKWLDHDFNGVDISFKKSDENTNKSDETKKYEDLYSSINYELLQYTFGEEFYDIYYNNKEFYDEYFIYTGIVNIIKDDMMLDCKLEKNIEKAKLDEQIKNLFGSINYNDKSFNTKNNNVSIKYDSNKNEYNVKLNGECSGFDYSNGGIKNIYRKAETLNNELFLYEKSLYVESSKDDNGNVFYRFHNDINKKSQIIANTFDKVDLEIIPTYVYKFIKENGKYTIKSINRIS